MKNGAMCRCRGAFGWHKYKTDHNFISVINSVQSSWRAKHYEMFEEMTVNELTAMAGGTALQRSSSVISLCFLLYSVVVVVVVIVVVVVVVAAVYL